MSSQRSELQHSLQLADGSGKPMSTSERVRSRRTIMILSLCVVIAVIIAAVMGAKDVRDRNRHHHHGEHHHGDHHGDHHAPAAAPAKSVAALRASTEKAVRAAMNEAHDPCDDFYEYSCGGWMKSSKIPADKSAIYLVIDDIQEANRMMLQETLNSYLDWPLINRFFRSCMDQPAIDKLGLLPLQSTMTMIIGIEPTAAGVATALGKLHRMGVDAFFSMSSGAALKDPDMTVGQLAQSGLSLPDVSYYTDKTDKSVIPDFKKHLTKMFELIYTDADRAAKMADDVIAVEQAIAAVTVSNTKLRNVAGTNNPTTVAGLAKSVPGIDWVAYMVEVGIHHGDTALNLQSKTFFPDVAKLMTPSDGDADCGTDGKDCMFTIDQIKSYFLYHTVHGYAPYLMSTIKDANFAFYGTVLNGIKVQQKPEKMCTSRVDSMLGQVLGRYYIQQAFDARGKKDATDIVLSIVEAFKRILDPKVSPDALKWMSTATRMRALDKLALFTEQVGWPNVWDELKGLTLNGFSHILDVMAISQYTFHKSINQIGQAPNKNAWGMTTPTVNAYYDPSFNHIVVPAGILQGLYYNELFHPAINWGGTGGTAGHETTHAYDDQGAQFDGHGNFTNWWDHSTLKAFHKNEQCLIDFYGNFKVAGGVHVNGELTLGENIADVGGIKRAFEAYRIHMATKPKVGSDATGYLNPEEPYFDFLGKRANEKLFFLAYAQGWCFKATDTHAQRSVKTDVHSPGQFRVLGPLQQYPEGFGEVFGCKTGDKMMLPKEKVCQIW